MKARGLAEFCVVTGQSPQTYYRLTRLERDEFAKAANKFHGGR